MLYALLFGLLGYVSVLLGSGAEPAVRTVLLRYWMLLALAVFAVGAPHVLLPDDEVRFLQLLNPSPTALLRRQLKKWGVLVGLFALPGLLLAFFDPGHWTRQLAGKALHGLEMLLVVGGAGLYSFERYATIGRRSQAWQEGRQGGWYRALKRNSPGGFAVPDGLVPAMLVTQQIFVVGILYVAAGAYAGQVAVVLSWIPGFVLFAWSALKLLRRRTAYDRHFYSTNAFYAEIFRQGGVRAAEREPVPYEGIYWVPRRWRPHVWAGLRQMDRRLPIGRFLVLGHLMLWILFFQQAAPGVIAAYLLLMTAAKNGASFILATEPMAAPSLHLWQQDVLDWGVVRFFVNLRWTFVLVMSLGVVALFDADFGAGQVLLWTAVDVGLAALSAALVTYFTEETYRKRHA